MSIKKIEYSVNVAGITPATEQFGGTQGDHKATQLQFLIGDELSAAITEQVGGGKAVYRFDVYDGEGGIWSSDINQLTGDSVSLQLEERHTRHGGKITVYLVLSVLSDENETELELYSFPAALRLKNRPEGIVKEGENYESISGLAEVAKESAMSAEKSLATSKIVANSANKSAQHAEEMAEQANFYAHAAEEVLQKSVPLRLNKGQNAGCVYMMKSNETGIPTQSDVKLKELDYLGLTNKSIANMAKAAGYIVQRDNNGNLWTGNPVDDADCINKAFFDKAVKNSLGKSAYEIACKNGFEGTESQWLASLKGEPGKDVITDQTFDPMSTNAQSGKAVAEALKEYDVRNKILDYIEYTILDGMVTITKCDPTITGSHIIPNIIEGCIVTSIGSYAFYGCNSLTSVTIPDSVTSIGVMAFEDCDSLTSVSIGDGVTSIGNRAFNDCESLTSIIIPDGVISLERSVFSGCKSLASVIIPDSVTNIGDYAFSGCNNLTDVYYKGSEAQWNSIDFGGNVGLDNATIHYDQASATKKAVAEAVKYKMPKAYTANQPTYAQVVVVKPNPSLEQAEDGTLYPADSDYGYVDTDDTFGGGCIPHNIARRDDSGNLRTGSPNKNVDCVNKEYVDIRVEMLEQADTMIVTELTNNYYNKAQIDNLVGDVETALDGIIALQNELIGGESV